MEYTVQKLGKLAGISTRTLRYYDEIGMLKPARINSSGYRIYGQKEIDRLQHMLFYRELGLSLEDIKKIMDSPSFNSLSALCEHREKLIAKKNQIEKLILNVEKTIAAKEGRITMSNREKFEGFKQKLIEENESKYGKEVREKYGDEAVERSNKAFMNMTEEQYNEFTKLGEDIISTLKEAIKTNDPAGELAQKAADLHRRWLTFAWGNYNREAHAGVTDLYVNDERFTKYYDQHQPGLAAFLREAVYIYTGIKKA